MYVKGIKVDSEKQKEQVKKFYSKHNKKAKSKSKLLTTWHSYDEYLKSIVWHNIRNKKLIEVEHTCQICYSKNDLEVHHRTYKRIFREKMSDLTVLCRNCHQLYHTHLQQNKLTDAEIEIIVNKMMAKEGYI